MRALGLSWCGVWKKIAWRFGVFSPSYLQHFDTPCEVCELDSFRKYTVVRCHFHSFLWSLLRINMFLAVMQVTGSMLRCGCLPADNGITEHFGLEGIFRGHLAQPPCSEQGHLQLDQVAQGPTWPWMFPGMGPPLLLWAICSSVSPPLSWICILLPTWVWVETTKDLKFNCRDLKETMTSAQSPSRAGLLPWSSAPAAELHFHKIPFLASASSWAASRINKWQLLVFRASICFRDTFQAMCSFFRGVVSLSVPTCYTVHQAAGRTVRIVLTF